MKRPTLPLSPRALRRPDREPDYTTTTYVSWDGTQTWHRWPDPNPFPRS